MQSGKTQSKTLVEQRKDKRNVEKISFISYSGNIKYCTTFIDCAIICDSILNRIPKSNDIFAIGFDLEWVCTYQTAPGKTAIIQMSPSLQECYLFHVIQIKNLPKSFIELITHPNVRLVGVNIKNDVRKLARDFQGIVAENIIQSCIDAGNQANKVLQCKCRWSMQKLVDEFFKMQIQKDKKVRCSRWDKIPLSNIQQRYAATDAYVSLKLYVHLKKLEMEQINEENELKTEK